MTRIFLGLSSAQWLDLGVSVLIVLFVLITGNWIIRVFIKNPLSRLAKRTSTILDDFIVEIIQLPLYLLFVGWAFNYGLKRLDFIPEEWNHSIADIFFIFYLVTGFIFSIKFIRKIIIWYGKEMSSRTETNLDEQLLPFIRRVTMIIIWLIGIIILLSHFNVDVSGLVATLGIGSLAIALAAQAALSDTISGFAIMIDRPFRIGDRIEIQDLDTWGDVVDIGLRSTRIRTRDNRMVIVPNSVIGKSLIVNYSYPDTQYRNEIQIGLAYGTDIERARDLMINVVSKVEGVLPDKPVEALFLEFGPYAMIFRVRWWLESYYDTRRMFDKVNTALYHALNAANIEIPNPQVDVFFRNKIPDMDIK
jgi:MscS family membrane protein